MTRSLRSRRGPRRRRGGVALVVLALSSAMAACGTTPARGPEAASAAHAWTVYDGSTVILEVSDVPGAILSTAVLPPGTTPRQHPFLSATARSARHEDDLHRRLTASASLAQFLDSLRAGGYSVVAKLP